MLEHATHRVGQLGEAIEAGCHVLDALRGEQEPVEEPLARAGRLRGAHVLGVRREDLGRCGAQGLRHGAHRCLALRIARAPEGDGCRLRRARKLDHILLDGLALSHRFLPRVRNRLPMVPESATGRYAR